MMPNPHLIPRNHSVSSAKVQYFERMVKKPVLELQTFSRRSKCASSKSTMTYSPAMRIVCPSVKRYVSERKSMDSKPLVPMAWIRSNNVRRLVTLSASSNEQEFDGTNDFSVQPSLDGSSSTEPGNTSSATRSLCHSIFDLLPITSSTNDDSLTAASWNSSWAIRPTCSPSRMYGESSSISVSIQALCSSIRSP